MWCQGLTLAVVGSFIGATTAVFEEYAADTGAQWTGCFVQDTLPSTQYHNDTEVTNVKVREASHNCRWTVTPSLESGFTSNQKYTFVITSNDTDITSMIGTQGFSAGQWYGAHTCTKSRATGCSEAECAGAFGTGTYTWMSPNNKNDVVLGLSCGTRLSDVTTTVITLRAAQSEVLKMARRQAMTSSPVTASPTGPPVDVLTSSPTEQSTDDFMSNDDMPPPEDDFLSDDFMSQPTPPLTIYPTGPTEAVTSMPTTPPTAPTTEAPTSGPLLSDPPTRAPTRVPTNMPTYQPTYTPTSFPTSLGPTTSSPTVRPTATPTASPSLAPTSIPTSQPTAQPTFEPTHQPTFAPLAPVTASPATNPGSEQGGAGTGQASSDGGPPIVMIIAGVGGVALALLVVCLVVRHNKKKQNKAKALKAKQLQSHKSPARASMAAGAPGVAANPNHCKYNAGGTRRCVKARLDSGPFCGVHQCPACPGFKPSRDEVCADCSQANQGAGSGAPLAVKPAPAAARGFETGYGVGQGGGSYPGTPSGSTAVTPSGSTTALDTGYLDVAAVPPLHHGHPSHYSNNSYVARNGSNNGYLTVSTTSPQPIRILHTLPTEYDGWGDTAA